MGRLLSLLLLAAWCAGVWTLLTFSGRPPAPTAGEAAQALSWNAFFDKFVIKALPIANRFDFPVRPPDGEGAFIARPFANGGHAGEDWNTALGDADLNEPIVSPADGWVSLAMDFQGGWGKVVLIDYRLSPGQSPAAVEMMFAHLAEIDVEPYAFVKRGQVIGKMGNAEGVYKAHLHWEVRPTVGVGLGGAYSEDLKPWIAPTPFVAAHRGAEGAKTQAQALPPAQWDAWGGD
jgi:murein DD-endopeptidase MepM/ murein hydrolase activator NlpD